METEATTTKQQETYILYVYCRRGGLSRDAGEHARGEYSDDAAAVDDLRGKVVPLWRRYNEVSWNIQTAGGRKVK